MENRKQLISNLVYLTESLETIKVKLLILPWDSEEELIKLDTNNLINILRRFIDGSISKHTLIDWANMIEGRDDIGFEPSSSKTVREALNTLANPELNGPVDENKVLQLIRKLENHL
jgi:hypothetical protein